MLRRFFIAAVSLAVLTLTGPLAGLVHARPQSNDTAAVLSAQAQPNVPAFEDGTVLVGFHEGVPDSDVLAILQRVGANRARIIGTMGARTNVAQVPPGLVLATIRQLQAFPQVRLR